MQPASDFLTKVLTKIARRYELKGQLSGTMKVGTTLGFAQLRQLRDYFGVEPIRINGKNEVRINFDLARQNGSESFWLERIGNSLGVPLKWENKADRLRRWKTLFARLELAFPQLHKLIDHLKENPAELQRAFPKGPDREATDTCFKLAETIEYLLSNTTPVTLSELGARFFNNSKVLRQGETRTIMLSWLRLYSQPKEQFENENRLLEQFSVYHDRLTVSAVIYGPIVYTKNGTTFDWIYRLFKQGETATLSWTNLVAVESMQWLGAKDNPPNLICCENEAPFSLLVRQQPNNAVLFTSGFPNTAVRKIYQLLAPHAASCYHWGDTDPNGLRIASILHAVFPLRLYRCNVDTLKRHERCLLPLTNRQKNMAKEILKDHSFPFREELSLTIDKGWLEQENWRAGENNRQTDISLTPALEQRGDTQDDNNRK